MPEVLESRRAQSKEGLEKVRGLAMERLACIVGQEPLAIYATGSFGRHEAVFPKGSDLDVFFLYDPADKDPNAKVGRLMFFELAAELIKLARELEFEEFSGDGEYLVVHNVRYIGEQLGSRHEDSENGFTARLLLLLESEPVLNEELYARMLLDVVSFYFDDYSENKDRFRPTFLLNDIMRFWRTLCLNYEHKRRSKREEANNSEKHAAWRAKSALDNFKLRFSRLSTCYSMVAALSSQPTPVSPQRVVELCRTPPSQRWDVAVTNATDESQAEAERLRDEMAGHYDLFLETTADKDRALERLSEPSERRALRDRAAEYGELASRLLEMTCQEEQRRTLLV